MRKLGALAVSSAMLLALPACSIAPATTGGPDPDGAGTERLVSRTVDFQDRLLLTGELQAVHAEKILVPRTPVWNVPIRWMATDGAWVKRGDKVLELDNGQFTGELEQKELAEASARNDLVRKQADVAGQLAEKEFAVEEKRILLEKARIEAEIPQNLRPLREHQEAQLAVARAEAEYDKALTDLEASRSSTEAELDELRIALARTREEIETARRAIDVLTLEAPRDGVLLVATYGREGRKYQVGDSVWVGLEVMRIPELSEMKIVARLSDVDDGKIAAGMRVRANLDIAPERVWEGHVAEITPVAQEESDRSLRRSFQVTVLLDESDPEVMRPGMSALVEVLSPPLEEVVAVPRVALDWREEGVRALLADGTDVEVVLGPCDAVLCVVEQGLSAGTALRRAA